MRVFRSFLLILSLVLLTSMSPLAYATPNGETNKTITGVLSISVGKSVVVKLGAPAATVFIANPEVADIQIATPQRIMVLGKKTGETTLLISDDFGRVLANHTVVVSQNINDLRRTLRSIAPNDDIKVNPIPNGLILTGTASNAAIVEDARRLAARYVPIEGGDIINHIKVHANNQIQIQVRFAEVSREADKRLGINWGNALNTGSFVFGLETGSQFFTSVGAAITRTTVGDDLNDALNFGFNDGNVSVNGMIDALAKNNLVTILAEPTLTAMSGETASFLAGGEFPIPIPNGDNITIEWKQYGVSLAFTPTILSGNRINLHVRPEVSQLSEVGAVTLSNITVPALTTRRAETTVELGSGQSFAIAGLLNNNQTQAVSKFPFLGDVPILGALFRSTRFQNNESELVIIITPYIVKPVPQEKLTLPTDGYSQPSETDRIFRMRGTNSDPEAPTLSGTPRAVKVEKVEKVKLPEAKAPQAQPEKLKKSPPPQAVVKKKAPVQKIKKPAPKKVAPPVQAKKKPTPKKQKAKDSIEIEDAEIVTKKAEKIAAPSLPISTPPPEKKIKNHQPPKLGGFIME